MPGGAASISLTACSTSGVWVLLRGDGVDRHGATHHYYLAVDSQLRAVLAWFGAHLVPGAAYLQSGQFQEGQLAAPEAIAELGSFANAVIAMQKAAAANDGMVGPSLTAARYPALEEVCNSCGRRHGRAFRVLESSHRCMEV